MQSFLLILELVFSIKKLIVVLRYGRGQMLHKLKSARQLILFWVCSQGRRDRFVNNCVNFPNSLLICKVSKIQLTGLGIQVTNMKSEQHSCRNPSRYGNNSRRKNLWVNHKTGGKKLALRIFHFLFVILIIMLLFSQKITVFCIVPSFVSSMIDDTEKLSLMAHFSYCLRNNET